ncbi:MAG: hypothetical protein H0U92_00010 [Actinobacteria bacterium]|nr:hypothetical protein [Actinomycetota bacterium]
MGSGAEPRLAGRVRTTRGGVNQKSAAAVKDVIVDMVEEFINVSERVAKLGQE